MRTENTWRGVKPSLPRTGPSKDLFNSKAIYGNGCGVSIIENPFGNIIKHIAQFYEVRKDA